MATKPIKFLELHYTMTQFLIINKYSPKWRWLVVDILIFISYLNRLQKASVDLKTIGRDC